MIKKFNRLLFITLLLAITSLFTSCKPKYIEPDDMKTVTFNVDGNEYYTAYVITGERAVKINGPFLEGRKFLYWAKDGQEYDFSLPVNERIILEGKFEVSPTFEVLDLSISDISNQNFNLYMDLVHETVINGFTLREGNTYSCYFYFKNPASYNIKFKISLDITSSIDYEFKYNFRAVQDANVSTVWLKPNQLIDIEVNLKAGTTVLHALDWKWLKKGDNNTIKVEEDVKYIDVKYEFHSFEIVQ